MSDLALKRERYGWSIYRGMQRIYGPVTSQSVAETKLQKLEKQRQTKERRCMCCSQKFRSEGSHNRLCKYCRQLGGGLA